MRVAKEPTRSEREDPILIHHKPDVTDEETDDDMEIIDRDNRDTPERAGEMLRSSLEDEDQEGENKEEDEYICQLPIEEASSSDDDSFDEQQHSSSTTPGDVDKVLDKQPNLVKNVIFPRAVLDSQFVRPQMQLRHYLPQVETSGGGVYVVQQVLQNRGLMEGSQKLGLVSVVSNKPVVKEKSEKG